MPHPRRLSNKLGLFSSKYTSKAKTWSLSKQNPVKLGAILSPYTASFEGIYKQIVVGLPSSPSRTTLTFWHLQQFMSILHKGWVMSNSASQIEIQSALVMGIMCCCNFHSIWVINILRGVILTHNVLYLVNFCKYITV